MKLQELIKRLEYIRSKFETEQDRLQVTNIIKDVKRYGVTERLDLLLESKKTYMYHSTSKKNAEAIASKGLKVSQQTNYTQEGFWAVKYYGVSPIYLSSKAWDKGKGVVTFKVDVSGLPLVADLPSLIDAGAYLDDDDEIIYWEEKEEHLAGPLQAYFDDDGLDISELVEPGSGPAEAAIALTKTAACLQDIPPEKLSIKKD